jgi:hypothetical protein
MALIPSEKLTEGNVYNTVMSKLRKDEGLDDKSSVCTSNKIMRSATP